MNTNGVRVKEIGIAKGINIALITDEINIIPLIKEKDITSRVKENKYFLNTLLMKYEYNNKNDSNILQIKNNPYNIKFSYYHHKLLILIDKSLKYYHYYQNRKTIPYDFDKQIVGENLHMEYGFICEKFHLLYPFHYYCFLYNLNII